MNINKLIRDPKRCQEALVETPDHRLIAKKPLKIYVPTRYNERGLASVGMEVQIVGIYAMVVEDVFYTTSIWNAIMRITPTSMMKIMLSGEEYYEFYFEAGCVVCPNTYTVKNDTLTFKIYDEIISKGRVPWYLGYSELARLFDTADEAAGAKIGRKQAVTELIISLIARDVNDRTKFYRQTITSLEDLVTNPPCFIPLRSVQYAATNTTNKLAGSYFEVGMVSALVTPADRVEKTEALLRK
jgi:hypothetical protein